MSEQKVIIEIHKLYISDLKIQVPDAPSVFANQDLKPNINLSGVHEIEKLPEEYLHLVKLKLNLEAEDTKTKKKIYHIEVVQCGIFEIRGLNEEQLGHALNVYAPTTLYPYAREAVSTSIVKAGFQSLYLQPINFETLYLNKKQQQAEEAKGGEA